MSSVRFETDGPVATVSIDRPEVRNAVDGPTAALLAEAFRRTRLENGALQITLPEINIWLDESGEITLNRINRFTAALRKPSTRPNEEIYVYAIARSLGGTVTKAGEKITATVTRSFRIG